MFTKIREALSRWTEARTTRKQLMNLSDRELADIGITRYDIDSIVRGQVRAMDAQAPAAPAMGARGLTAAAA